MAGSIISSTIVVDGQLLHPVKKGIKHVAGSNRIFFIKNYLVDCCFKKSYHSPVKDPHGLFTGAAIMFHVNLILTLNKYYEKTS